MINLHSKYKISGSQPIKSFDELKIGDICLFGRLRDCEGLMYMGIIKSKNILQII